MALGGYLLASSGEQNVLVRRIIGQALGATMSTVE